MRAITAPDIHPPFSAYAHAVEVPPGARWLVASGQLGIGPEKAVPEGVEAQTALCLDNLEAVLAAAGMTRANLVRLNAYVTDRAHFAGYMAARDRWLTGIARLPASTVVVVSGFNRPEFLVEVEMIAAG